MVIVGVKDGVVQVCVSVNSIDDVADYYPDHLFFLQVGNENVGWTYDGVIFTPPKG